MGRRADGSLFPACVGRGSLEVDGFHGFTLLVRDLTADKARERQMLDGAIRDSLTGVNSRSGFEELSLGEVHRSGRYGRSLCAVLAELDHFHKINERYGRLIGDLVLLNVASALQSMLRRSDLIARWSGKKFAMLLVETESTQAAMAAERLRAAIADLPIPTPTGPITQTLSVGVAPITERRNDFAALFSDAERALQLAKELGRNRVEVALD
jgi:diguanylate cyclase (GGDEF)-like protein